MIDTKIVKLKFYKTSHISLVLLGLTLSIVVVMTVSFFVRANITNELHIKSTNILSIQALNAQTYTEKFGVAAAMLSRRNDITNFVQQPIAVRDALIPSISRVLDHTNALAGSNNIWLVDNLGNVLITSNTSKQIIEQNIEDQDYFKTALQGRLGRANLIQSIDKRFYIFAAPIYTNNGVVGATIILVPIERIEQSWALIQEPIIITNKADQILLSNIDKWQLRNIKSTDSNDFEDESFINPSVLKKNYIITEQYIPLLDWKLAILQPKSILNKRARSSNALTVLGVLLMWILCWFSWQRYQRIDSERKQQVAFSNLLEEKVVRRTEDLSNANKQLEKEVDERKQTELELRITQKELIQSAKMASIGQMSTVLAHEYNQPISAIQFYAVNAKTMLEQSQQTNAKKNMERIAELTTRMASLTTSLRNFAHKPGSKLKKVKMSAVIDLLQTLMQPRLKSENVNLIINPPEEDLNVMAGDTRLAQIISNLIANSIDAIKNQEDKEITLEWHPKNENKVEILIKDNGPGLPKNERDNLYDAFYTTKGNQEGLGLGLFIVYNLINELGGKLIIIDEEDYGAVFCIILERHD